MEDTRIAYGKATKRRGDKQPFFKPQTIVIACVLIVGFAFFMW